MEAISQKTPVITSNKTPWEILKKNAGYWISPSINSINKTLNDIINMDNKKYSNIQNNANLLLKDKFNKNNISLWNSYYSSLNSK